MKTLIIGAGEVGKSLFKVLSPYHETFIRDLNPVKCDGIEILQICYPDHDGFIETTKKYISEYKPLVTIINSSVKVGTTRKCGDGVVYSPIRGRHPDNGLDKEMTAFTKFVAGLDSGKVKIAGIGFSRCGWGVRLSGNPDALEYLKLMSNVHMGLEIAWRQEIGRMMNSFSIEDTDYEAWEKSYQEGYLKLGQHHLIRPLMSPKPIGGHCIIPCTEILQSQYPSKALNFILESDDRARLGE